MPKYEIRLNVPAEQIYEQYEEIFADPLVDLNWIEENLQSLNNLLEEAQKQLDETEMRLRYVNNPAQCPDDAKDLLWLGFNKAQLDDLISATNYSIMIVEEEQKARLATIKKLKERKNYQIDVRCQRDKLSKALQEIFNDVEVDVDYLINLYNEIDNQTICCIIHPTTADGEEVDADTEKLINYNILFAKEQIKEEIKKRREELEAKFGTDD